MSVMRFLIVGCGSIGKRHAANLLALGHDVAAYNRGAKRRREMRERFNIKAYCNLEKMLKQEPAEGAIICTPQTLHVEHALAAARHGLHLFIEKPLAASLDGLDELKQEVRSRNLTTHVGANMRFHLGPAMIHKRLQSGEFGRALSASFWAGMHLPDWHPDEDHREMYSAKAAKGGGAVLDFIHELDLVLWLFGAPNRVAAMTANSGWLEIETEDVLDALLGYSSGLQVNVHLDYLQRPFQRGIRVVGEKGWIQWDLAREQIESFEHASGQRRIDPYPEGYDHNDMYVEQMKYYIYCIENGIRSESDILAGQKALELALQIKASSTSHRFINGELGC